MQFRYKNFKVEISMGYSDDRPYLYWHDEL